MSNIVFGEDIVLDEAAFDAAIEDFAALSARLQSLRLEVEEMLEDLHAGFDTPAGDVFIRSCQTRLFQPLEEQKIVLDHIAQTLSDSKASYEAVFAEYETIQDVIRRIEK